MSPLAYCPRHGYARRKCSVHCLVMRRELERLGARYRQLWYDRRRGVKAMPMHHYMTLGPSFWPPRPRP